MYFNCHVHNKWRNRIFHTKNILKIILNANFAFSKIFKILIRGWGVGRGWSCVSLTLISLLISLFSYHCFTHSQKGGGKSIIIKFLLCKLKKIVAARKSYCFVAEYYACLKDTFVMIHINVYKHNNHILEVTCSNSLNM